ncbi:UBC-like protein, partial [Coniochaeta ligniaria NRRL 30616]
VRHRIKDVLDQPDGLVTLGPESDNFAVLLAAVQGPSDTPYEGGVFYIRMRIPRDFPLSPPVCYFLTPVLHPNITSNGKIVINVLTPWQDDGLDHWSPIWSLGQLLQAFLSILCDPDWFNAASPEISQWYGENPWAFEAQSRILTQRFAQGTKPMERPYAEAYFEILRQLGIHHPDNNRQLLEAASHHQENLPRLEPRQCSASPDDDETDMPLFIAIIAWFAFCLALHFLFVEPSLT